MILVVNLTWKLTLTAGLGAALAACGEATASPSTNSSSNSTASSSSADAFPLFSAYVGHYTGSWNNNTFNSTGSLTWDISVSQDRKAEIQVTAGGNVFGGTAPATQTITLSDLGQGSVSGQTNGFGSVSGTVTPGGAMNVTMSSIPGGSIDHVTAVGTFSGSNKITFTYTVYFSSGGSTATGTATLNKS